MQSGTQDREQINRDEEHRARSFFKRHRGVITIVVIGIGVAAFVVFVLPQIKGLSGTLHRLRNGDPWWLALGVVAEVASLSGYGLLFRTVFSCHGTRIGFRESYEITLAGTVASKLLSTAGAGGVALTVWALRASGLSPRVIARRMLAFELLLYVVFAGVVLIFGVGLRTGLLPGKAPWTLTVIPAIVAGAALTMTFSLLLLPASFERTIVTRAGSSSWGRRMLGRLASAPGTLRGAVSTAAELIRERNLGVLGAVMYWGFDIATLWASLHAFGNPPPFPAIVMAYFVGQVANLLPLPGGVGGVEGGMIGALIAFGAPASLALLGVLAYRLISFWLPTLPGGWAYVRLRQTVGRWRELDLQPDSDA